MAEMKSINVVVSGHPTTVRAALDETLVVVRNWALQFTGNIGQPVERWEFRSGDGELVPADTLVSEYKGHKLYLSLKAGHVASIESTFSDAFLTEASSSQSHLEIVRLMAAEILQHRSLLRDIVTGDGTQLENLSMSATELSHVLDDEDFAAEISADDMRRAFRLLGVSV